MLTQHLAAQVGPYAARAALYLASEDASWITGIILDVAGGAVMAQ
jgi:NAD(P)-dependent dehydrogenase (short-subunit alcohol dehydrogenase family)